MKFGGSTRWNCRNTQKMSKRKRRKWQYDLQSCSRYKKAYLMKKWIFSSKLISLFKRSQLCFCLNTLLVIEAEAFRFENQKTHLPVAWPYGLPCRAMLFGSVTDNLFAVC